MGRQARQRPVSCTLCRVRKLRCSRIFPCSNCTSRGVVCQHENSSQSVVNARQAKASHSKDASTHEILERLERLEALVASQNQVRPPAASPTEPENPGYSEPVHLPASPEVPSAVPSAAQSQLQRLTADASCLERACLGQNSCVSAVADPITFRTCPIRLISKPSGYVLKPDASGGADHGVEAIRCIWLPRREETHVLMQKYLDDVSPFHHIVHAPSMAKLVDKTYDRLERGDQSDAGAISLLLAVCTTATYAWTTNDDSRFPLAVLIDTNAQATSWLKAYLDIADHAQRIAHVSIECVQGTIAIFYVLWSLEGVSTRTRSLLAKSIAMARELGLHRIDNSNNATSSADPAKDPIHVEISRRVWWYLTTADWMLTQFCLPQEGTYTIHQNQMAVRKPRNVDDEEIVAGREVPDHPLEQPTCVSYSLQRIRLAEVCHGLLDPSPFILLDPETLDYQQILDADLNFRKFISEMPSFFSFEENSRQKSPVKGPKDNTNITIQRYLLNFLLHRQRCKLHLPYLARGAVENKFAYSREVCLDSARIIISTEHRLQNEKSVSVSFQQRSCMVLRSIFVANIALVLDACLGGDGNDTSTGGGEVAEAWRILDEAQHQSPVALKLLELSMQVLEKHRSEHPALDVMRSHVSERASPKGRLPSMTLDTGHRDHLVADGSRQRNIIESDTGYLEQQWEGLHGRMDLAAIDWDRLFWGLDASFI